METDVHGHTKPSKTKRNESRQNTKTLIKILNSSDAKRNKIIFTATPVEEIDSHKIPSNEDDPRLYKSIGDNFIFMVDRRKLFESLGKENAWYLLPKSTLTIELDADGKPKALYPPLPKYSEGNRRIVESQEPFYVFR